MAEIQQKVAIVTDSNSGITQAQGKEFGIKVLPMPFFIDGELYHEEINLTQEEFYKKLGEDSDITTSQPTPGDVMELWDGLLETYEEVLHIPMSSGLSSSCHNAVVLAKDYDGKVQVVDNQRISVTQRQSVLDAIELAKSGKSAIEIREYLETEKLESSIYITVDTLKYLKKGGRITAAAAAIGTVLNLKPVLQIQGDKLDAYAKVRGWKQAKKTMLDALDKDLTHRFSNQPIHLQAAYTCSEELAMEWKHEIEDRFPKYNVYMDKLSLSVSCHLGPGAMAIACTKKMG
ncbi:MAG: DegV family protein [Lachnospiraceae bacterium]